MPIDPNIYNQLDTQAPLRLSQLITQATDPMPRYMNNLKLKSLMGEQELQGMQLEKGRGEMERDKAYREALQGGGSLSDMTARVRTVDPEKALAMEKADREAKLGDLQYQDELFKHSSRAWTMLGENPDDATVISIAKDTIAKYPDMADRTRQMTGKILAMPPEKRQETAFLAVQDIDKQYEAKFGRKIGTKLIETEGGQILVNEETGVPIAEYGAKPVSSGASDSPMNVREWEYYNQLTPQDQERYLAMKRAQQNVDIGGSVVQPALGRPGVVAGEFGKTLPPEKTPEAVGQAKTAEKQAELSVEKQKLYPKARETKKTLERQWDVVDQTIDKALAQVGPFTAGAGSWAAVIPASPQRNLRETLKTIQANIGFDKLQSMRENSPTGGALGQVSDFENRLLQAVQGSLDQGQSPSQLTENLKNVKMLLGEVRKQKNEAFKTDFSQFAAPSGNTVTVQNPQTGEMETWDLTTEQRVK